MYSQVEKVTNKWCKIIKLQPF